MDKTENFKCGCCNTPILPQNFFWDHILEKHAHWLNVDKTRILYFEEDNYLIVFFCKENAKFYGELIKWAKTGR